MRLCLVRATPVRDEEQEQAGREAEHAAANRVGAEQGWEADRQEEAGKAGEGAAEGFEKRWGGAVVGTRIG